ITKSLWFYSKLADNTPYQFTAYNIPTGLSIPDEGHDYGYIPPMQGFWVKANADVDYTFNNEMRVHKPAGSPAIFRTPQAAERQLMRLQLSNGIIKDEAAVLFSEEATNDWNTPKMTSQKLCIYTLKDGENLALNSNKAINYDVEIPVGVKAESGVYTFSASKLENFGAERVFLLDKVANTTTNLSNNDIHTVNFAENYEGTDRFALVFPRSGVITGWDGVVQTEFYAYAKDKRIIVSTDAESGTIYVYNSVGQQVAAETISGKLTTVSAALPEGVYVVKLNNQTTKVVVK
ncbi:MAG TPA: T9SS type A sorting domain-containing protein, partial [Bacteroidales bacterium]|nr:T9SS type A sorting domain-containing protein [Bacteroidales bacterium]